MIIEAELLNIERPCALEMHSKKYKVICGFIPDIS